MRICSKSLAYVLTAGTVVSWCAPCSAQTPELVADLNPPAQLPNSTSFDSAFVHDGQLTVIARPSPESGFYQFDLGSIAAPPTQLARVQSYLGRVLAQVGDVTLASSYDGFNNLHRPLVLTGATADPRDLEPVVQIDAAAVLGDRVLIAGLDFQRTPTVWTTDSNLRDLRPLLAGSGWSQIPSTTFMHTMALAGQPSRAVFGFQDGASLSIVLTDGDLDGTTVLPVAGQWTLVGPAALPGQRICWITNQAVQVSDGTVAGTRTIGTIPSGGGVDTYARTSEMDGRVWFLTAQPGRSEPGEHESTLWVTDGTTAGTGPVFTAAYQSIHPLCEIAGVPHFVVQEGEDSALYRIARGTRTATRVRTLSSRFRPVHNGAPDGLRGVSVGTRALARLEDGWRLLSSAGPDLQVSPTASPSALQGAVAISIGNEAVFENATSQHGNELWITDGTAAGTRLLHEFSPGGIPLQTSSAPEQFVSDGRHTFFIADARGGRRVYRSDGTATGTQLVPGDYPDLDAEDQLAAAGGRAYFTVRDGATDYLFGVHPTRGDAQVVAPLARRGALVPVREALLVLPDAAVAGSTRTATMVGPEGIRFEFSVADHGHRDIGDPAAARPTVCEAGDHLFIEYGFAIVITDGTEAGTTSFTIPLPATEATFYDGAVWYGLDGVLSAPPFLPPLLQRWDPLTRALSTEWTGTIPLGAAPRVLAARDRAFVVESRPNQVTVFGPSTATFPAMTVGRYPVLKAAGEGIFAGRLETLHYVDDTSATELCPHPLHPWGFDLAHDREAWFAVDTPNGSELWRSDGTVQGTHVVSTLNLAPAVARNRGRSAVQSGKLWLSAESGTEGFEPHVIHLTHAVEDVGAPCGRGRAPRLYASAVSAGSPATFHGDAGGGTVAMVLLSPPPMQAVALDTLCRLHVDPANLVFTAPVPVTGGDFSTTVPLPPGLDLLGAVFHAQAVFGPTDYPLGVDLTQALRILVGP